MSLSHEKVIERFYEGKRGRGHNVYSEEENGRLRLYSYGPHFPLAVKLLKDGPMGNKEKRMYGVYDGTEEQRPVRWLLNGDTYSSSTSHHQRLARSECPDNAVTMPFSALREAIGGSIWSFTNLEGIEILDFREDHYRTVKYIDGEGKEREREEHILGATLFTYDDKYFLAGVDDGLKKRNFWRGEGFFIVELPRPCTSIGIAYDVLKPDEVREAEEAGREVKRQGEFFFVEVDGDLRLIKKAHGPVIGDGRNCNLATNELFVEYDDRGNPISGNPHRVLEAKEFLGGYIFARGGVKHPQHKTVTLKKWNRVFKSLAVRSISASGNVD